ncbi:MAG: GHKL domain-containing protein, partial [Nitrospinae bacterium]|nr:GHKL domain-containing protein [Nitrospinota bacterium]
IGFTTGFLSDIIHKKNKQLEKIAQERDQASKELEESVEIIKEHERLAGIGEFSAVVAHEVRNPLYGMLGAVEIIEKKIDKKDKAFFCINTLKKEIERLKRLTSDFLLYASPKKHENERLDIVEIIKNRIEMTSKTEKRSEIQFSFQGNENAIFIDGNKDSLEQVIHNILNNASEAMINRISPTITVTFEKNEGLVKILLEDNGKGMDEKTSQEVFKPFFSQSDNGTGLGLSISKRIIEEHGGTISLHSKPNKGTTVEITLPLQK